MASKKYVGRFRPDRSKYFHERSKLQQAASIAISMQKAYRPIMSGLPWPHAHCLDTCLILAPIIRSSLEWDVTIVVGRVADNDPHAWLESTEWDILDPTFGSFDGGPPLRILPARQNWVLGHWPEFRLSRAQEQQLLDGWRPRSGESGWTEDCGAVALMRDHPQLSPLLR